jgi:hypothetical protein
MCITVVLAIVVFKQRKCKVRQPAFIIPHLRKLHLWRGLFCGSQVL